MPEVRYQLFAIVSSTTEAARPASSLTLSIQMVSAALPYSVKPSVGPRGFVIAAWGLFQ